MSTSSGKVTVQKKKTTIKIVNKKPDSRINQNGTTDHQCYYEINEIS